MTTDTATEPTRKTASVSVLRRRFRKFRTLKRGWYSFLLLVSLYVVSFFTPLLINSRALIVKYQGDLYFPVIGDVIQGKYFGQRVIGETDYRALASSWAEVDGNENWVLMPPYPYNPTENFLRELKGNPPHAPSATHWFGTDAGGRDVLARLVYGFNISLTFGLGVVICSYILGTIAGSLLGFLGGRFDILGQRLVEIWGGLPFLYTIMIMSSIYRPKLAGFIALLSLFSWIGVSYYMRGEFYREKAKDYVAAAIAQGESQLAIMFRHILPNALTPIISFAPFALVSAITSMVALDFLGFGLPAPTPTWGELMQQGLDHVATKHYHLVICPVTALFCTLLMVVFIGEAVREAFDPKVFSRLR